MESETAINNWKDYNEYTAFCAAPARVFPHHERATELQLCSGMRFEVVSSERDTFWIAQLVRFDDKQLTLKWETSAKSDTPSRGGASKGDSHEFTIERSAGRVKRLGWAAANRIRAKVPHGVSVRGNTDALIDELVRTARVSNVDVSQDALGYNAIECVCPNMLFEYLYDALDAKAVWFVKAVANLGGRLLLTFVASMEAVNDDSSAGSKSEETSSKSKAGRKPSPKKGKAEADSGESDLFWSYYTDFRLNAVGYGEQHAARQFRYTPPPQLRMNEDQATRVRTGVLARRNAISPFDFVFSRRAPIGRHSFTLNERLEALDTSSPMHIRPARVSAVHDEYFFSVTLDAYREVSTRSAGESGKRLELTEGATSLCCAATNTLFPVCFAKANALVLTTPPGFVPARDESDAGRADAATSHDIDWLDYLRTLSKFGPSLDEHEHESKKQRKLKTESVAADEPVARKYAHLNSSAATRVYPTFLKRGHKIECVNPRDPFELILVTVQRVFDSLLWVAIDADPHLYLRPTTSKSSAADGEAEAQCFFVRIDSTELFPVGFAERFTPVANAQLAASTATRKRVRLRFPFVPRTLASDSREAVRIHVNSATCFVGQSLSAARLSAQPSVLGNDSDSSVNDSIKQLFGVLLGASVRPSNLLRMLKSAAAKKPKRGETASGGAHSSPTTRVRNEVVQLFIDGQPHETESRVCQTRFAVVDYLRQLCATLDSCPYLISPYRIGSCAPRTKQADRENAEFTIERCPARCDCFFVSRQRLKRDTVQRRLAQLEPFGITRAQINDTLSTIERYKMGEKRDEADASDTEDVPASTAATTPSRGAKKAESKPSGKKTATATKTEPKSASKKQQVDSESVDTLNQSTTGANKKRKAQSPKSEARKRAPPPTDDTKRRLQRADKSPSTPNARKRPPNRRNAHDKASDVDPASQCTSHDDAESQSDVSLSTCELSNFESDDQDMTTSAESDSNSDTDADSDEDSDEASQSASEPVDQLLTPPAKRKRNEPKAARPSPQRAKKPQNGTDARKPTRATTNGNASDARRTAVASEPGASTASDASTNCKVTPCKREVASPSASDATPKGAAKQRETMKQTADAERQTDTATPMASRFVPPMSPPIHFEQSSTSGSAATLAVANPHAVAFVRRHVPANMNPLTWTVQDLAEYLRSVADCGPQIARRINEEQIDGRAFLLLTVPLIREQLKVPLGPALKLSVQVEKLKLVYVNCFA